MNRLDCSDRDAAIDSVARLAGLGPSDLLRRLKHCSFEEMAARATDEGCAPEDVLPKLILGGRLVVPSRPVEVMWFHGTRVIRATEFKNGLLPMAACLPGLVQMVEQLAVEAGLAVSDLNKGQKSSSQIGKLSVAGQSGPYASLIREHVVHPQISDHNYLDGPEMVVDLAQSVAGPYAPRVLDLYRSKTAPCIVWFLGLSAIEDVLACAMRYIYAVVHDEPDPAEWNTCFDGGGQAVPASRILKREWLDG